MRHLSQEMPAAPGIRIYDIPFPLNDAFDALGWLASQPVWPQFYWQQRNGDEEAAVLGAVAAFSSLESAQQFLRQHDNHPDLRIWGLNAFEPQRGNLLLPRLEWRRCAGWRAYAYISTATYRYVTTPRRRWRLSHRSPMLSRYPRCVSV
jgi:menaquinone-specific isochorismate synthase